MLQAQWTREGLRLVDVDPPPLAAGWVRLRVEACGICGSDLHVWRHELPATPGGVPGHEICGSPIDGPAGLADALYAVEPRVWCGHCDHCATGDRHLCRTGQILGLGPAGGLAEFVDVPRASLHALPDGVGALLGSLAEPLAVAVRAVRLAQVDVDSRVLVLGAGTIGLLAGLLARERAREVAITARHQQQRKLAAGLGLRALSEAELGDWARDAEPDVVIETVGGRADTLASAVRCARGRGRIVVLGVFGEPVAIDMLTVLRKELILLGSDTYALTERGSEFGLATAALARHADALAALQTHQFTLDQLDEAFLTAADKARGAIKVTLVPA